MDTFIKVRVRLSIDLIYLRMIDQNGVYWNYCFRIYNS